MRLHITTTKGIPGVQGTLVLDSGQRAHRAHYADIDRALYKGVAKALQLSRGLWGVSIDGVELETGDVVDRLKAYSDDVDGVGGRGSPADLSGDSLIDRMIVMVEERGHDGELSAL